MYAYTVALQVLDMHSLLANQSRAWKWFMVTFADLAGAVIFECSELSVLCQLLLEQQ
jgi:hypothetical protein